MMRPLRMQRRPAHSSTLRGTHLVLERCKRWAPHVAAQRDAARDPAAQPTERDDHAGRRRRHAVVLPPHHHVRIYSDALRDSYGVGRPQCRDALSERGDRRCARCGAQVQLLTGAQHAAEHAREAEKDAAAAVAPRGTSLPPPSERW